MGEAGRQSRPEVPHLHFLIRERSIDCFGGQNIRMMNDEIGIALEGLGIGVPDLDDIMGLLRADGDAIDDIAPILCHLLNHGRNSIALKDGAGLRLENANAVASAIDIVTVLPEGRNAIAHQEEHSIAQRVLLERNKNREEVAPCAHFTKTRVRSRKTPVSPLGRMPEQSPVPGWDRRIECSCHYG